jgi:DNA-binding NarL/FixJ family response regulator
MTNESSTSTRCRQVVLVDSKPIENQLLAEALRQRGFNVFPFEAQPTPVLEFLETSATDVVVVSCAGQSGLPDMGMLRTLHFSHPRIPKIALLDFSDRGTVSQAFRFGARGLFCLADSSFQLFCDCIEQVARGEVWATTQQFNHLLDSIYQMPGLRVVSANGEKLLTSREEQVVALVADGLSNRDVATELGLSEHTVKKYLFRIFEKLGISNRVELVLYAVHHTTPQAAWIA